MFHEPVTINVYVAGLLYVLLWIATLSVILMPWDKWLTKWLEPKAKPTWPLATVLEMRAASEKAEREHSRELTPEAGGGDPSGDRGYCAYGQNRRQTRKRFAAATNRSARDTLDQRVGDIRDKRTRAAGFRSQGRNGRSRS